jgi:hypothetical protein
VRKYRFSNWEASLRAGLVLSRRIVQQGKWQRKQPKNREATPRPELALVADSAGQSYRVSLQELTTGQPVLLLYGKDGRLICNKAKLGRGKMRRETIGLTEIRRIINPPNVEIPARVS